MNVPEFPAPPSLVPISSSSAATSVGLIREPANKNSKHLAGSWRANDLSGEKSFTRGISVSQLSSRPITGISRNLPSRRRAHRLARIGNSVHPRVVTKESSRVNRPRVTELKVSMTERREDDEDDADVVCASGILNNYLTIELKDQQTNEIVGMPFIKTIGIQTREREGPYWLRVFPKLKDIIEEEEEGENSRTCSKIWKHLRFLGRLSMCQFGLAWLLTFWAIAGAAAFYATEGPRETKQVAELKDMQRDLAVGLATELRQLKASEEEMEPLWSNKVRQYVAKHEKLLLAAVNSGYGEGGESGELWTFSGCILFAISLLTTLGENDLLPWFGAPVPRTNPGRTVAVVFAAIGIPAHFLLIFNLGLLLAVRLQQYAVRKRYGADHDVEAIERLPVPQWVKIFPFILIAGYYLLGIIGFGAGRSRPLAASLLFPLDFTAAGGLASTSGFVRIAYGLYLEGAVTIAAVTVAALRVSASESLANIGRKYGLLVEA
ncbi:GSCOCG00008827001-RA-CDS [Cotesia congregata]|nr:GSCOCG00008827001-RA-CDS [Cotesia congregata]